ncbi:MAG: BolA family transcriptional regulator [Methylococcales bacterium]|nr:BolA family transcriptional regulator [Methylococcales bacterium]
MTASSDITKEIKQRIESAIQDSQVEVISGGERHFALKVISKSFENLSPVKQQQMVYAAIKDLMAGNDAPIHAIDKMDIRIS